MTMEKPQSASASYDLTSTVSQHLDPHMVIPLLDFVESLDLYDTGAINRARLSTLQSTQMVDLFNDVFVECFGDDEPHDGMQAKPREVVIAKFKNLQAQCKPLLASLEEKKGDRQTLSAEALAMHYGINESHIEALYDYAKFMFDCGRYQDAAENLFYYRILSRNESRCFLALWGQLAADILLTNWDDALIGLNQLSEAIEGMVTAPQLTQLKYRTWLIHWSLFVFFNHENGRTNMIEFFNKERYLNTIQTSCPHILRYLTAAIIINRRRRTALNDLVKVVTKLDYVYSDPIIQFLKAVYLDFDFEAARGYLDECEAVLSGDFFLLYIKDEFIEAARLFYFETYCRVHETVSIDVVARTLAVSLDEAERWIVELIRSAGLDARIDSHANHVVMSKEFPSVYQKIIDKTKSLTFRTHQLVGLVDKKYLSLQEA